MQPEIWKKIELIFNEAAFLPAEKQADFVKEKTNGDLEVREIVLRLLANDKREGVFLDEPVFTLGSRLMIAGENEDLIKKGNFAHYHLLKTIGRGGMGLVFLAQDTRLNRKVALKLLPVSLDREAQTIARFRQEARAASRVTHPNVAHIYEFGECKGRYYLAMEYVPGRTLRELLKEKAIDRRRAMEITLQIAAALDAAHGVGVIHRDIKPENIIVLNDGTVKVLDFGLAKIAPVRNAETLETSLETVPGLIMGTTAYMSPEQIRGKNTDRTTDLWSLGVILYEMLAGERPFQGETPGDVQAAILKDEPPFSSLLLPDEITKLLRMLLNKDFAERCQSAQELIQDLEKIKRLPISFEVTDANQSLSTNSNLPQDTVSGNSSNGNSFASNSEERQIEKVRKTKRRFIFAFGSLILITLFAGAIYFFPIPSDKISSENTSQNSLFSDSAANSQNPEALREYQMGQHIWNKRQVIDMPKALEHFQRAIELDPGFAQAYVGLANAYQWGGNPNLSNEEKHAHVKASLQRALALNPNSVEARATLAFTLGSEKDWHGAEREYRKALEIDPNYAQAHHWYAEFLASITGRNEEAVAHIKRARELDPLAYAILSDSVMVNYLVGRYDEAIANAEKIIAFDARYERTGRAWLARLYPQKGDIERAKKEFKRYEELHKENISDTERANYLSLFGEREEALDYIRKVENSPDARKESLMTASTYAILGFREKAFDWLEISVENNNPGITLIAANPEFDSLHSDPRFMKLLERMKLAEFWKDKLSKPK